MSDIPFYRTRMGQRFYEHTVPELVRQIARVGDLLEKLVDRADESDAATDDRETE